MGNAIIQDDGCLGLLDDGSVAIADDNGECDRCCGDCCKCSDARDTGSASVSLTTPDPPWPGQVASDSDQDVMLLCIEELVGTVSTFSGSGSYSGAYQFPPTPIETHNMGITVGDNQLGSITVRAQVSRQFFGFGQGTSIATTFYTHTGILNGQTDTDFDPTLPLTYSMAVSCSGTATLLSAEKLSNCVFRLTTEVSLTGNMIATNGNASSSSTFNFSAVLVRNVDYATVAGAFLFRPFASVSFSSSTTTTPGNGQADASTSSILDSTKKLNKDLCTMPGNIMDANNSLQRFLESQN